MSKRPRHVNFFSSPPPSPPLAAARTRSQRRIPFRARARASLIFFFPPRENADCRPLTAFCVSSAKRCVTALIRARIRVLDSPSDYAPEQIPASFADADDRWNQFARTYDLILSIGTRSASDARWRPRTSNGTAMISLANMQAEVVDRMMSGMIATLRERSPGDNQLRDDRRSRSG